MEVSEVLSSYLTLTQLEELLEQWEGYDEQTKQIKKAMGMV